MFQLVGNRNLFPCSLGINATLPCVLIIRGSENPVQVGRGSLQFALSFLEPAAIPEPPTETRFALAEMEERMKRRVATLFVSLFVLTFVVYAAQTAKTTTLKGWVSDQECAAHGDKKCSNKQHVANGSKLVIVTDGDNKIWVVTNPSSVADHQGHYIQVKASTDPEKSTITVQDVKMLKEGS